MDTVSSRLSDTSVVLPLAQRELAILRFLGRLGVVNGQTIAEVVCPEIDPSHCRRILRALTSRKLIWATNVPHIAAGRSHGRPPRVYGLADDGKQMLATFGAEAPGGVFTRLIARPKQSPALPSTGQLAHDRYVSDWLASLLDHVRRTPALVGVAVQRSYALTGPEGALLQTIGALITLAFDPNQKTYIVAPPAIPWLSDGAVAASWRVVRLALEVDTGAMSQPALLAQAQTYRTLHENGSHQRLLGGALRPVIITHAGVRASIVADVWVGGWPNNGAIIASDTRTASSPYGVLWGEYKALAATPLQPTTLVGPLLGTVAQWPSRIAPWPELRPAKGTGKGKGQGGTA